jgi:DNA processing protein
VTTALSILGPDDVGYPHRLSALAIDHVLHVRGQLGEGRAVAIVGARAASQRGMDRAHVLARHLAAAGVRVVSGGAIGIDGAAHRGALDSTVVLGSGIDVMYPARHAQLFDQIVASGGALVSMFPLGTTPRAGTFVKRNALISGLADAVIVVEADVRSGSLITAKAAHQQGRLVGAYPGSPGTQALLAQGAALVENSDDVLALLDGRVRAKAPVILDENAARVRDALVAGVRGIDQIVRHTGLSVRAVLRALPQLESSARLHE